MPDAALEEEASESAEDSEGAPEDDARAGEDSD